jgi:pyruvate formate lyase activating enzyme
MLRIHSVETFGTHEGPGIRLVIFLQGCLFNCLYCHNPDTIPLNKGKEMSNAEILEILNKGKNYYGKKGGLTASGGEPTLQAKDLVNLFKIVKRVGFNTALDTNGYILNDDTKRLFQETDLVLLDVKHIDNEWHKKITGKPNLKVLETAEYLESIQKRVWLRYVLVPGYSDQPEFLEKWARHFQSYRAIERVEILPYHTLGAYKYESLGIEYKLKGVQPPGESEVQKAKEIFEKYLKNVYVR